MKATIALEMKNGAGIYEIRNLTNNKVYVGSTTNFDQRLRNHRSDLLHKKHSNGRLLNAYLMYGMDAFQFTALFEVQKQAGESKGDFSKRLLLAEFDFIERLGANNRNTGYNLRIDPATNFGINYSKSTEMKGLIIDASPNMAKGENNHNAVLNEAIVREIKILLKLGYRSANIAKYLSISFHLINEMNGGRATWAHIEITQAEIEAYSVSPLLDEVGVLLNDHQVKRIKYFLSKGQVMCSVCRYLKVTETMGKSIKCGNSYRDVILDCIDIDQFEKLGVLNDFREFFKFEKIQLKTKFKPKKGSQNTASILTESNVLLIKEMLLSKQSPKKIAPLFGVSSDCIYKIKWGVNWSHVTGFTSH